MTTTPVPTLYDWLGGIDALNRLTNRFYEHVAGDALLAPVFAHMGAPTIPRMSRRSSPRCWAARRTIRRRMAAIRT